MFRFLNDVEDDPYMMDPFAAHRQQMTLFQPFAMDPFALTQQMQPHRVPRRPACPLAPFGMMGMGGGFMDMFGMMGQMMGNVERMTGAPNCQTFSSSTVISYSSMDTAGIPKVYQQTSQTTTGPGGIRETRQSVRDSESGLERLAIGHHIGERAHIMERSRNRRTGDREDRQDFINLDETDAAAFDEEWRREAGRYVPPNARSLEYGRERRAAGGQQLALPAPPSSTPPATHRHESPRHRQQPPTRPRYDW